MSNRKKMRQDFKPQFLTQVLDTIARMRDSNGSPPQKIMQRLMVTNKVPAKKAELVLKKALRSGIKSGLIREVPGGKYKLGMDKKDYQVFKKFQKLEEKIGDDLPLRQVRRKRRRSRRRRGSKSRRGRGRRRRRRQSDGVEDKKTNDEDKMPVDEGNTWNLESNLDIDGNKHKKKHSSDTKRRTKKADADHEEGSSSSRQRSCRSLKEECDRKYVGDFCDEKEHIHESDPSYDDHCLYRNPAMDHHNELCQHHGYDPNNYC